MCSRLHLWSVSSVSMSYLRKHSSFSVYSPLIMLSVESFSSCIYFLLRRDHPVGMHLRTYLIKRPHQRKPCELIWKLCKGSWHITRPFLPTSIFYAFLCFFFFLVPKSYLQWANLKIKKILCEKNSLIWNGKFRWVFNFHW